MNANAEQTNGKTQLIRKTINETLNQTGAHPKLEPAPAPAAAKVPLIRYWPIAALIIGYAIAGVTGFTVLKGTAATTVEDVADLEKEKADKIVVTAQFKNLETKMVAEDLRLNDSIDDLEDDVDEIKADVKGNTSLLQQILLEVKK
jgi:hypothetical protein